MSKTVLGTSPVPRPGRPGCAGMFLRSATHTRALFEPGANVGQPGGVGGGVVEKEGSKS
jgi:hypothetical protein